MFRLFPRPILLIGAAAGAAAVYLFDPERGAERRAMAKERASSALGRGAGTGADGGGGPELGTTEATPGGTSAEESPQWDAPAVVDGGPAADAVIDSGPAADAVASARVEGSAKVAGGGGDGEDRDPLPPTPGA